jgi:hypothetical protein
MGPPALLAIGKTKYQKTSRLSPEFWTNAIVSTSDFEQTFVEPNINIIPIGEEPEPRLQAQKLEKCWKLFCEMLGM